MNNSSIDELLAQFNGIDKDGYYGNPDTIINQNKNGLIEILSKFKNDFIETKAVVGFDIYQYSQYDEFPQITIPILIKIMLKKAIENMHRYEKYFFPNRLELTSDNYIDTGDGGFIVFSTPLHALCFIIHFSIVLKQFNSYIFYPVLRDLVKEINIRFALTYDQIYKFNDNIYGTGIINNARILSKDKLNRFLCDENTNEWFLKNINGIDTLRIAHSNHYIFNEMIKEFVNKEMRSLDRFSVFSRNFDNGVQSYGIDSSIIQKIGTIKSKKQVLSIFGIQIQASLAVIDDTDNSKLEALSITVGNLNTEGLMAEES